MPHICLLPLHCKALAADNFNRKTQLQISQPLWLKSQGVSTYTPSSHYNLGFTWQQHTPGQSHHPPVSIIVLLLHLFLDLYLRFPAGCEVFCFLMLNHLFEVCWVHLFFFFFFKVYLFLREREPAWAGEEQRERETDSEAGSSLWAVNTEPDAGFELTNHEILT